MADQKRNSRLDRESRVFAYYLIKQDVSEYVLHKYRDANEKLQLENSPQLFDSLLVKIALLHPLATKICDAYARFFSPRGRLRKKLILLLSILELTPPYYRGIDAANGGSQVKLFAAIIWKGATTVFSLILSVFILLPLQVLLKIAGGERPAAGKNV